MDAVKLKDIWFEKYRVVSTQLEKIKQISTVSTAFNTNIDAICKIKGEVLAKLIKENNITLKQIENINQTELKKGTDVILGIIKCFTKGIAEEWVTEDKNIYKWMEKNLGCDYLQMGGQGGIIANTLALLGVQKVITHTNSHPKLQAKQFLNLDNLLAFNQQGKLEKAANISRENDIPLIHWIIEFNKGDSFKYDDKEFICPKSNRFIATYDPLNMNLAINKDYISYMNNNTVEYLLLSGFHPLLVNQDGLKRISEVVPIIQQWQKNNKNMITHLEIASTRDKIIRKAIIDKIIPLVQSAGLNERETIDLLEIINQKTLAEEIEKQPNSCNLFKAILLLKEKLGIPRIQLHMFGLYLTIQDKCFPYTAEQNLSGMMTASIVSSAKAYLGALNNYEDITITNNRKISDIGLKELATLSKMLNEPDLVKTGICNIKNYTISAIPTIIIDNPKTLVGMGDTISSISLLAGR